MAARNLRYHEALALEAVRPGVVELLAEAAERGIPCAVASSSPREWVEGHLERLELSPRFVAVRTRDDVEPGRAKPAPDLYLAACRAAGGEPGRCIALEDAPQGIASARAAGMKVVGVAAGLTSELPLDGADLVVPSLAEVTFEGLAALVEP
jgi:HAD superfamily hydrolase (TIGR01509 family)